MAYYLTVNIEAKGTPTADGDKSVQGHMWYSLNDGLGTKQDFGFTSQHDAMILLRLHGAGRVRDNDELYYVGSPWYSRSIEITKEQCG